jgi:hypothetical protein
MSFIKSMLSEGSKISSKRVSLGIFTAILVVSYFSEQWFGLSIELDKFDALIGLVEITLLTVLGDKLPAMLGRTEKKNEETPGNDG